MVSPVKDMLDQKSNIQMFLEVKQYQIMKHTVCKTMGLMGAVEAWKKHAPSREMGC